MLAAGGLVGAECSFRRLPSPWCLGHSDPAWLGVWRVCRRAPLGIPAPAQIPALPREHRPQSACPNPSLRPRTAEESGCTRKPQPPRPTVSGPVWGHPDRGRHPAPRSRPRPPVEPAGKLRPGGGRDFADPMDERWSRRPGEHDPRLASPPLPPPRVRLLRRRGPRPYLPRPRARYRQREGLGDGERDAERPAKHAVWGGAAAQAPPPEVENRCTQSSGDLGLGWIVGPSAAAGLLGVGRTLLRLLTPPTPGHGLSPQGPRTVAA